MSEPQAGTQNRFWTWVERIGWILGVITALVAVLLFFQEYQFVERDRYAELVDVDARYDRGELIAPVDCPDDPERVSPPDPVEPDPVTILTAAIDELVQEARFLAKHIDAPEFFPRFDEWRSNAKARLADGQKLMQDAGWTSPENWEDTFHRQTHIKTRDLTQEPYRPEEYRGFLESGSRVLERMKREVILHSGRGNPPAGGSSSAPLTPDS